MSEERPKRDPQWPPGATDKGHRYLLSSLSSLLSHCLWKWWVSPSPNLTLQLLYYELSGFERLICGLAQKLARVGLGPTEKLNQVQGQTGSYLETRPGPGSGWVPLINQIASRVRRGFT